MNVPLWTSSEFRPQLNMWSDGWNKPLGVVRLRGHRSEARGSFAVHNGHGHWVRRSSKGGVQAPPGDPISRLGEWPRRGPVWGWRIKDHREGGSCYWIWPLPHMQYVSHAHTHACACTQASVLLVGQLVYKQKTGGDKKNRCSVTFGVNAAQVMNCSLYCEGYRLCSFSGQRC